MIFKKYKYKSIQKEKVDIEDLVSHSEPTGIPNLETIDLKEEPSEQISILMTYV